MFAPPPLSRNLKKAMTKFECAAVVVLLVVAPIGGYLIAHCLAPELIANYDGRWLAVLFEILSGVSCLYDALILLLLLTVALCFVLAKLGVIDPKNQNEEDDR